ncbi:signal peptidase complex subunit 1 [Acyrthosiphon pisum]|uniref:Signal peptidase complex subunit 1 n=1 Tax=Acyrthosiphon pisum TaxID=7029 RepID=C4WUH4_ACYPI|nr:signal peptidase complex subunit 1 [Acyrthosiphon pisum]BAH71544.1 ACYPI000712 [Acyrthosiphon pisum]|eukprot:NP_001155397.1 signal peptidase complex subunit 1 [Acyrthosiphon pisum]
MFENLSIWKWHMDFVGQKHAEYLFRTIITMCGFIGFILGYVKEQFSITIGLTLIGFFISALLTIPPWPIYARNPLKWQKVKKVKKIENNLTYDEYKEDKKKEKKKTK